MMLTHKKVNVISNKGLPLYFLKINTSLVYNITLPLSDIFMAIQMGCTVEEETKDGKIILDITNFDRDFNEKIDETHDELIDNNGNTRVRTINMLELDDNDTNSIKIEENKNSLISRLIREQNIIKNKKI